MAPRKAKPAPIVVEDDAEDIVEPTTIQALQELYDRDGKLTPDSVLIEAQDPSSALHKRFEWDDSVAAHEYRKQQARQLIRIAVTVVADTRTRAFEFVPSRSSYTPIAEIMSSQDLRDELLSNFQRDADRFRARWATHRHIADAYKQWVTEEATA